MIKIFGFLILLGAESGIPPVFFKFPIDHKNWVFLKKKFGEIDLPAKEKFENKI